MSFLPCRLTSSPAKELRSILNMGIILLLALGLLSACGSDSEPTPQLPTRTPVPTFTPTPYVIQSGAGVAEAAPVQAPAEAAPAAPVEAAPAPVVEAAPAPVETAPQPALAIVTSPTVNLRTGPGTTYALAGQANRGEELAIVARDGAGEWFQVCCVNGQEAWVAAFLVETQGPVEGVAVAQNIPAPPPTNIPAPVQPTNTPAPAQPTQPPPPSFAFAKFGNVLPQQNSNPYVTFFGALFNKDASGIMGGYKMVAEGPAGRAESDFGAFPLHGNPGLESEYIYNAKIEFNATPGVYKVYVTDGGGNPVAEAYEYTVEGDIRTFLPRWKQN